MKKGILNIAVSTYQKTSLAEAGIFDLDLPDGTKVLALGHSLFPDHDRSLFEHILYPLLRHEKPDVIIGLGGLIHDDAFTLFAPRKDTKKVAVHPHDPAPELAAVLEEHESFEERVQIFGAECGRFVASMADAGDSHFIYIPSASPILPNEWEIVRFVYYTKNRIDEWMEKHPQEAPENPIELPVSSADFVKLLGLEGDSRVTVLPFGSAVCANQKNLFMIGDFRRKDPLSAAYAELGRRHLNIIRGFDSKLSSGWFTTLEQSFYSRRRFHQFHEVGNLMSDEIMGYIRDYDFWAKGFFFGTIVNGELHGCSHPVEFGADGRRCMVINGHGYQEPEPAGLGKRGIITLPTRE